MAVVEVVCGGVRDEGEALQAVRQRLDDGRVQRAVHAVVRGAQVLGTCGGGSVEM